MKEDENLIKHLNVLNWVIYELSNMEKKFEDEELLLLISFPSSFEHIVITFVYIKYPIKLDEVFVTLLSNEFRKIFNNDDKNSKVLVAQDRLINESK